SSAARRRLEATISLKALASLPSMPSQCSGSRTEKSPALTPCMASSSCNSGSAGAAVDRRALGVATRGRRRVVEPSLLTQNPLCDPAAEKRRNRFGKGSPWGTRDPCTWPSREGGALRRVKAPGLPGARPMLENEKPATQRARMPLPWKLAIGFVAGLLLGRVAHYAGGAEAGWVDGLTTWVTQPVGTLFLRLIFMLVIPLLFSALVVGVAEMGDIRSLGRIGWKTLAYTVIVSGIAVMIGLLLV